MLIQNTLQPLAVQFKIEILNTLPPSLDYIGLVRVIDYISRVL